MIPSVVIKFLCQGRTLTTGDPAELTLRNMEVDCNGTLEEAIRQVKILRKETSILTKAGMHKGANVASLQEVIKRGIFGLRGGMSRLLPRSTHTTELCIVKRNSAGATRADPRAAGAHTVACGCIARTCSRVILQKSGR